MADIDYPPYACTPGPSEEIATEIVQKVSGSLSIIGSTLIVFDVVRKVFRRSDGAGRTDSYQRIMLGLSFSDIVVSSFDAFAGQWMTPEETGWAMARGNQASCTAQGFLSSFGYTGSFMYQMALSLNIFVLISLGWSQEKFARTIEIPIHVMSLSIALAFAIVPLPFQGYNPHCGSCLSSVPLYDTSRNVVRGSQKLSDACEVFYLAVGVVAIIFCTITMAWIYISVRRQEKKMMKYSVKGSNEDHHRESKRISKVLLLYTLALYLCWGVPGAIFLIASNIPFWLSLLLDGLLPLCGFFNMMVYFLPNCLKYQRDNPEKWLISAYMHVLGFSQCTQCCGLCGTIETGGAVSSGMNFAKYNGASKTKNSSINSTAVNVAGNANEEETKEEIE